MLGLFDMERIEANLFRATNGPGHHVFGGQVLAQAATAAAATVPEDRALHSLHAYFLRRGDHSRPILFEIDRIRDGRSFTTRRAVGIQKGQAIFSLSASFQKAEAGVFHQSAPPEVSPPEELRSDLEHFRKLAETDPSVERFSYRYEAIDSRQVEGLQMVPRDHREALPPAKNTWMRVRERLPDAPIVHQAVLAYMSDMDFMSVSLLPHGRQLQAHRLQGASLDHAIWYHRPLRADEWLLFTKESPSSSGARGFVRGAFYSLDGQLVASTSQECLIRLREKEHVGTV